jgi:hypothetical protein
VAAAIVPFALAFLALAALNGYFFGDPLPSAGARLFYVSKPFVTTPTMTPQIGGTGLFIDRIFGLFRNAPEYMLGLLGVIPLLGALRRRSPIAILLTAVFALYVFALSMYFYWHADWTPAPRYLVSLVPFLAVVTALGIQRLLVTRVGALVTVLLAAYSAAITYLFLAHPSLMYNWGTHEEATRWTSGALGMFLQRWIGFDPGVVYPSLWWLDGATLPLSLAWCAFAALLILAGRSGPRPVVARAPTPEPVPETS